jgi:hypothetical protein
MLRNFIRKNISIITKRDIQELLEYLDQLSPWPWKPKDIIEISQAIDLEFTSQSPEVVHKLCRTLQLCMEKNESVTFSYDIPTCRVCKYWTEDPELEYGGTVFGICSEPTQVGFFGDIHNRRYLTPNRHGCINGEKREEEKNG